MSFPIIGGLSMSKVLIFAYGANVYDHSKDVCTDVMGAYNGSILDEDNSSMRTDYYNHTIRKGEARGVGWASLVELDLLTEEVTTLYKKVNELQKLTELNPKARELQKAKVVRKRTAEEVLDSLMENSIPMAPPAVSLWGSTATNPFLVSPTTSF
jgi:hypothetical protein